VTRRAGLLLLAPALLLLLPVFLVPLVIIAETSIRGAGSLDSGWTLAAYRQILSSRYFLTALVRTFGLGLGIAALSTVLATPLAWWLIRNPRWKLPVTALVAAPLLVNVVARLEGWQLLLSDSGPVNAVLLALLPGGQPVLFLGSTLGVAIALLHIMLPYVVLALLAAMQSIDPTVLDAADTLARPGRVFWTVALPLSLPGLASGFLLAFTLASASFVIPAVIGGGRFNTFPTLIYQDMLALNTPRAAALAMCLLAALLPLAWAVRRTRNAAP
jgi:putative spermidine/putrescine transport system permease protein